jgi:hypothetical protein
VRFSIDVIGQDKWGHIGPFSLTILDVHHPVIEAPAGGIRLPIAHATTSPARGVQGNRALGATRSRARPALRIGAMAINEPGRNAIS